MITWLFANWEALIVIAAAAFLSSLLITESKAQNPAKTKRVLRVEHIRAPANLILGTVGITLPIVTGFASYSLDRTTGASVSALFATVLMLLASFLCAFWVPIGITKLLSEADTVTLSFPKDRSFLTALGLANIYFLLALLSLVWFLLSGLLNYHDKHSIDVTSQDLHIKKPRPALGMSYASVIQILGEDKACQIDSQCVYATEKGSIVLTFNANALLIEIKEVQGSP
ncbi:MAG: hypothetical protein AAGI44_01100 [Pseudomonadota bacterium]